MKVLLFVSPLNYHNVNTFYIYFIGDFYGGKNVIK